MLIVISCVNTNLHIANMLKDSVSFMSIKLSVQLTTTSSLASTVPSFMSIKLSVQLTLVGKVTLFFA